LEFRIGLVLSRTWDLLSRRAPIFLLLVGGGTVNAREAVSVALSCIGPVYVRRIVL